MLIEMIKNMLYSNLYKNYYPFHSSAEIQVLDKRERNLLVRYIKIFPDEVKRRILKYGKCGLFNYKKL